MTAKALLVYNRGLLAACVDEAIMNYTECESRRRQALGYETDPKHVALDPTNRIIDDRTSDTFEKPVERLIYKRKECFSEDPIDQTSPRDWIHERLHKSFKLSSCVLGTRLLSHKSTQPAWSSWHGALEECISSNGEEVRSVNATMPMDLLDLRIFSSGRRDHDQDDLHLYKVSGNFHLDLVEGDPGSRSYEGFSKGAYRGAYFVYEEKIKGNLQLSLQIRQIVSHDIMDRIFSRRLNLRKCFIIAGVQFDCYVRQDDVVWSDAQWPRNILLPENQGYTQLKHLDIKEFG